MTILIIIGHVAVSNLKFKLAVELFFVFILDAFLLFILRCSQYTIDALRGLEQFIGFDSSQGGICWDSKIVASWATVRLW